MIDQITTRNGDAGDPLSHGDLLCKLLNSSSVLEVVRQRLLLAEDQPLRDTEHVGMASMIGTIIKEINSSIVEAEDRRKQ